METATFSTTLNVDELTLELEEYGFVVLRNLIPEPRANRTAERLMDVMNRQPNAANLDQNRRGVFNDLDPDDDELLVPMVTTPADVELARHLLGEGMQMAEVGALWNKPGAPADGRHADVPVGWFARNGRPTRQDRTPDEGPGHRRVCEPTRRRRGRRGRLTEEDRDTLLDADIVVEGRRTGDWAEVYVLMEVSNTIDRHDLARTRQWSQALAKLGRPVIPVLAGREITASVDKAARNEGVWRLLGGRAFSPDQAALPEVAGAS